MIKKHINVKGKKFLGEFDLMGKSGYRINGTFQIYDEKERPIIGGSGNWESFEEIKNLITGEVESGINKEIAEWDGNLI